MWSRDQQLKLIEPVSREEIYNAIMDLDDQRAPGYDGFNSHFFKMGWQIVGEEIIAVVTNFIDMDYM